MAKQTQIKIDKGVPIPGTTKRGSMYPWDKMQPGDSFFVEGAPKGLYTQAAAHKIKITVRKVTERGKEGVRVWRVSSTTRRAAATRKSTSAKTKIKRSPKRRPKKA